MAITTQLQVKTFLFNVGEEKPVFDTVLYANGVWEKQDSTKSCPSNLDIVKQAKAMLGLTGQKCDVYYNEGGYAPEHWIVVPRGQKSGERIAALVILHYYGSAQ